MRRRILLMVLAGAAVYPLLAGAQQKAIPVIGYLSVGSPETDNIPGRLVAFRRGLVEAGYVEEGNVVIEYRWAEGHNERLPSLAADLVGRQVSVIVAPGAPVALAAKAATSTLPIAFIVGIDPIESGLVASLNRPGGNVTGVSVLNAELAGKRLDLLHQLLPTATAIALLVNPTNRSNSKFETTSFQDAARVLGLEGPVLQASTPSEIDAAFGALVNLRAAAIIVAGDPFFTSQRAQFVALAARGAVPAIYVYREFVTAGGLMSYGTDLADSYRQLALYAAKILSGAKPAELPVQQVVKLELVINLNTAKALGLTVPPSILARADEAIE